MRIWDTIVLGHYANKPIEWLVLAYSEMENAALLISKYALDTVPFHEPQGTALVSWNNCSLRKWLNDEFFKKAFSPNEQYQILPIENGKKTYDMVFLLNKDEADSFRLDTCEPTEHCRAEARLIPTDHASYTAFWWLMPTQASDWSAPVQPYDRVSFDDSKTCVRPAIWVSCS